MGADTHDAGATLLLLSYCLFGDPRTLSGLNFVLVYAVLQFCDLSWLNSLTQAQAGFLKCLALAVAILAQVSNFAALSLRHQHTVELLAGTTWGHLHQRLANKCR